MLLIAISETRKMPKSEDTVPVTLALNDGYFIFTVKIEDFETKMKTWPTDKFIGSESFFIEQEPMSLKIYPNGDGAEEEGNVSVYLKNDSDEKIQVDFTFMMRGKEVSHSGVDLKPYESFGSALYSHKGVANVGSDEDTKISCKIKFGGFKKHVSNITLANSIETIRSSNDELKSRVKDSTNELKRKYDSIESKVEEGNSNIEKRMARLESKLEASSESIKAKIDVSAAKNNNSVVKPKCPICFEEMSTKIAQCISGHLLCWPCKEKMGDKACAFCDQPVNGRAFGMEAYLRTIFG